MNKVINITPNEIKQAIDDLVNENEMLQDKVYKLESIIKEVREYIEENKVDLSWFMATDKGLKIDGISNVVSTFRLLEILDKGE